MTRPRSARSESNRPYERYGKPSIDRTAFRPAKVRRGTARLAALALPFVIALSVVSVAPPAAAKEPRLLLLPIVVHSSEDPDYLRAGLSDMLASRFERIGALDLRRGSMEVRGTTDPDEAIELARKAGADYVLYGSFTRFGQGASLDVQCAPVTKAADGRAQEPLREIFVHSGSIGEIIPDLDELAGKVSRFARGEIVATGVPAAPANGGAAGARTAADLRDLRERVAALEAALTLVLENQSEDGTDGELR